jgi:uncharacterized sulfatase
LNYQRPPLAETLRLEQRQANAEELEMISRAIVAGINRNYEEARADQTWAEQSRLPLGGPQLYDLIETAYQREPLLGGDRGGTFGPPKPVYLSRLMSRLGISGIYIPFTGEPNFNAEQPDCDLPYSIAHEKAHQRGFAREDEANFIAFLICVNSAHPYARYSGYLNALSVLGVLNQVSPDRYRELAAQLGAGPRADLKARSAFWQRHLGKFSQVTRQVNHAYLKANRIRSGVSNYGEFLRLVIYYYLTHPMARPSGATTAEPLNLISVVTDDQARWSVGAYGNRESRTPNMDRLAREGARFVNAFVATPVCSPSRASFLTGRYGTQVGITDYIAPVEAAAGVGLPSNAITWPRVLQQHGYTTALIGKWHLGTQPQFHPTRHGFDHFFGSLAGSFPPMDPRLEVNGKETQLTGPGSDLITDEAIRFVESNRARPFALLLHFREPHLPYGPMPAEDRAPFKDLDPTVPQAPGLDLAQVKNWTRDYYAAIHAVDRNLGRLLRKLDELDLARRTIVLFTSDHGYLIGHHGLHTKGNAWWVAGGVTGPKRPNMFEESIRVPLLIRWPSVAQPGREIAEPVSNLDTFASALGMLGIPMPAGVKQEGADFSPLLRGQKTPWREAIFGQYDLHNEGLAYLRMIRTSRWKLVRHHFSNLLDELYHLEEDPGETRNLYRRAEYQQVRDQLQERLTAWQRSIDDPILRAAVKNLLGA